MKHHNFVMFFVNFIKASEASRWYRGGSWGDGSDPVGAIATAPTGIKQSGPNFQGVIKVMGEMVLQYMTI